jgi:hypothetical protein
VELDKEKKLIFLVVTLRNAGTKLAFDIYREPSATDGIIQDVSCPRLNIN